MTFDSRPVSRDEIPDTISISSQGAVGIVELRRPAKRNALDDPTVLGLEAYFSDVPEGIGAIVLHGEGDHFCAGLDLSQLSERSVYEGVHHSRMWHRALGAIEGCRVPVFAVLKGAVIGGGLELASSTHVRVAERSTLYALPEGQHGLFVGGGASVRVPKLIGTDRMMDMMLTGRRYDGTEGERIGLSQYVVDDGAGYELALKLATKAAENPEVTNYAVLHVLPRISAANPAEGYFLESLIAGIAQGTDEAKSRMQAFLNRNKKSDAPAAPAGEAK